MVPHREVDAIAVSVGSRHFGVVACKARHTRRAGPRHDDVYVDRADCSLSQSSHNVTTGVQGGATKAAR